VVSPRKRVVVIGSVATNGLKAIPHPDNMLGKPLGDICTSLLINMTILSPSFASLPRSYPWRILCEEDGKAYEGVSCGSNSAATKSAASGRL
jgi:hypothetical protein